MRVKGFYEGMYKGFYKNSALEYRIEDVDECLGDASYLSLDLIAKGWDIVFTTWPWDYSADDFTKIMTGGTALVRLILDNEANCKFDKILLDTTTFCFINNCSWMHLVGNFF